MKKAWQSSQCQFTRKERDFLSPLVAGKDVKEISGTLEISETAARGRGKSACRRAGVSNLPELVLYVRQNPHSLVRGGRSPIGLHLPVMRPLDDSMAPLATPCACGQVGCPGYVTIKVILRPAF